jgi:hypothetical protein
VTDPINPIVLGKLDTHTIGSDWGDIKVYQDVAYIGSEAVDHGMQIHDLLTLREFYGTPAPEGTVRSIPEQLHYDARTRRHPVISLVEAVAQRPQCPESCTVVCLRVRRQTGHGAGHGAVDSQSMSIRAAIERKGQYPESTRVRRF